MQRSVRSHLVFITLLACTVALSITLWACSGDDSSNLTSPQAEQNLEAFSRPEFVDAIAVHNRHIPDILAMPKVAGTAVGMDGHGKPVIKIYTEEPLAPGLFPDSYDGYRVVQQVTGRIRPFKGGPPPMDGGSGDDPKAKQSPPVKMGTSGGWQYDLANGYCCGGTLGALVQVGGTKYILSNWHVLYSDIVSGGNSRVAQSGDPVIQPGLIDVGCIAGGGNTQVVGTLVNNGGSLPGPGVDVGIAAANGSVDLTGAILNVGTPAAGSGVGAFSGQAVKKMGRTTGLTRSTVDATNGAFSIQYANECAGGAAFVESYTGQIVIVNDRCKFQDGGDSGSLLLEDVDTNPRAVGLCFAGSVSCNKFAIAIANPISDVLGPGSPANGGSIVGN
jgi:hypothetical protein